MTFALVPPSSSVCLPAASSPLNEMDLPMTDPRTEPSDPRSGAQAIARSLSILRLLALRPADGLRIKTISQATGLHVATCSRMVRAMQQLGFVEQDGATRRYRLGFGAALLGAATASRLQVSADIRALVDDLAERTGESIYLSVRQGLSAVFVYRATGSFPIRAVTVDVGTHVPLGVGAAGMAILSTLPDDERAQVLQHVAPLVPEYRLKMSDVTALMALADSQGYALMDGRTFPGIHSVGVAIPANRQHVQAGLSLSAIAERLDAARQAAVAKDLRAVAARIAKLAFFKHLHAPASQRPGGAVFW